MQSATISVSNMTERLYYTDSYLRRWDARVVDRSGDGRTIYLDRTAFYPTSGGQPFDIGSISGVAVLSVADEDARIAHQLAAPLDAGGLDGAVECAIDWNRRFDHMQQHTGQHLLSAVFEELFALHTVSFHLGAESSTIDLEGAAVEPRAVLEAERRANEIVFENRAVSVLFEDAASAEGLRKPSGREGTLRIVAIDGLDRSACGGTHVRSTGEIGTVLCRKLEKIRQSVRVEFVCGGRAVRRARADYEALAKIAQLFSSSLDETPAMVAAQLETARAGEKARRKVELDLAAYQGRELYQTTAPGLDGIRRVSQRVTAGSLEELRAVAQNFTAQPKAVFVAALNDPPSVLLAASADAGIDAGKILKAALTEAGGRGGGNPRMAQGSVPEASLLERVLQRLAGGNACPTPTST
jgi:alanyl-tRNA synthetase